MSFFCRDLTFAQSHLLEFDRLEKQKRRLTGFLKKIRIQDSVGRQIQVLTNSDLRDMMLKGFLQVSFTAVHH